MENSTKSHQISVSFRSSQNPSFTIIETEVNKLKTLDISSVSPLSIQSGLVCLAEVYLHVEELVCSPQIQQAFFQNRDGFLVEDALKGSVGLLDSCSNLQDLLVHFKENVQVVQSALRRKGGDSRIETQISAYFCFRKKAKKNVAKSLGSLKQLETQVGSSLPSHLDHHIVLVIRVLREVVAITISVLRSILMFSSVKADSANGYSFISKFIPKNRSTYDRDQDVSNEVEMVDFTLHSLHRNIRSETKCVDVQMVLKRLQNLESMIEGFES